MKIRLLKPLLIVGVLLMLWQMVATLGSFPHYIFPSPQAVGQQLFTHAELLWQHTQVTLLEIGLGLLLGFLFGLISALLLIFSSNFCRLIADFGHFASDSCICYCAVVGVVVWLWNGIQNCDVGADYLLPRHGSLL